MATDTLIYGYSALSQSAKRINTRDLTDHLFSSGVGFAIHWAGKLVHWAEFRSVCAKAIDGCGFGMHVFRVWRSPYAVLGRRTAEGLQ